MVKIVKMAKIGQVKNDFFKESFGSLFCAGRLANLPAGYTKI